MRWLDSTDPNARAIAPIVIGKDLGETIGAGVGDTVLVTSPQGELTPLGIVPRYERFRVVGIFASGFYQYDSTYCVCAVEGCAEAVFGARSDFGHQLQGRGSIPGGGGWKGD